MKRVTVDRVEKAYPASSGGDPVRAVDGVSLDVAAGEFFVLLGASGSGKSTLLRCLAGLESLTGGTIAIGGVTVATPQRSLAPDRRNIGMVFQDYAIWPHMTVEQNVAFALRHARTGSRRGADARGRVLEVLDLVGLAALAERPATRLSGGQQQRVAVARAVVAQPDVLLLDEPLSNLDARLRATMRRELRRITEEVGVTSVYVTHDQVEALMMADRIAVMRDGRVLQVGSPEQIYRRPADVFVGEFVGEANLIPGRIRDTAEQAEQTVTVTTALGPLQARTGAPVAAGQPVQVLVRPENLHLRRPGGGHLDPRPANAVSGTVQQAVFAGAHTEIVVRCGTGSLRAQVHAFEPVDVGDRVTLEFNARWATAIPDGAGRTDPGRTDPGRTDPADPAAEPTGAGPTDAGDPAGPDRPVGAGSPAEKERP